jgi:pimeloyl-ACP methyl ester carboxylesterase
MDPDHELSDLGSAAEVVVERLVEPVEGMHRVISRRAFRYIGRPAAPVERAYAAITGAVYESIRRGARVVGDAAGAVWASRATDAHPISGSRTAAAWQSAINAVWGDHLDERAPGLSVAMSVRDGDRTIGVEPASVAATYPEAEPHVVVLVHGLGQTELCWHAKSRAEDASIHGALAAQPGITPVPVRYNTGLPVARNGAQLVSLITALDEAWPVTGPRISLVGYSMGGLVARSAAATATAGDAPWADRLHRVVTVGTPHHGSPIVRGLNAVSQALGVTATTRPLAGLLGAVSEGIGDLRDGKGLAPTGDRDLERDHYVAGVVTDRSEHPLGALAGDLVVRVSSATDGAEPADNVRVVGRRRHFDLLADPAVAAQIVDWLAAG